MSESLSERDMGTDYKLSTCLFLAKMTRSTWCKYLLMYLEKQNDSTLTNPHSWVHGSSSFIGFLGNPRIDIYQNIFREVSHTHLNQCCTSSLHISLGLVLDRCILVVGLLPWVRQNLADKARNRKEAFIKPLEGRVV